MDEFGFQGAEDALDRRIVPAVWLAAHRWGDGGGLQDLAVVAGGILAGAVRMMDQARPRTAPLDGHGQCGHGKFGAHMLAPRPTNYLAGEPVEDHGQVEPASPVGISVISANQTPAFAGAGSDPASRPRNSGRAGWPRSAENACCRWCTHESEAAREPGCHAGASPARPACGRHSGPRHAVRRGYAAPISAPVLGMNPPDIAQQFAIGGLARAFRP